MRRVNLYQVGDFLIIIPLNKTNTQGFIESMYFIKISIKSSDEMISATIKGAFEQYIEGVENPTDWKEYTKERSTNLKKIGFKSESELYKIHNKHMLLIEYIDKIEIIPSENIYKQKYFSHLPDFSEYYIKDNIASNFIKILKEQLLKCK